MKFILPTFNFKIEKWKWNKEYRVYVSTLGHFKDEHKENLFSKINSKTGYAYIKTSYGLKAAHRLVLLTWKPIPNSESLTVDHLDHNKRNNALNNLEWVTREENQKRARRDVCSVKCRIQGGNIIYKDLEDAVAAILKLPQFLTVQNKPKTETIRKNILKALITKKKYQDISWEYID